MQLVSFWPSGLFTKNSLPYDAAAIFVATPQSARTNFISLPFSLYWLLISSSDKVIEKLSIV